MGAMEHNKISRIGVDVPYPERVKCACSISSEAEKDGIKIGVPDICLPVSRGEWNVLFVEMKRTKGSTTSDAQKEYIKRLNEQDSIAVICYGAEQAIENIIEYLKG